MTGVNTSRFIAMHWPALAILQVEGYRCLLYEAQLGPLIRETGLG